jgi:hypothetical protein
MDRGPALPGQGGCINGAPVQLKRKLEHNLTVGLPKHGTESAPMFIQPSRPAAPGQVTTDHLADEARRRFETLLTFC